MVYAGSHGLVAKVGGAVDENVCVVILQSRRASQAFVMRVVATTHLTSTQWLWYAGRCACAEKCYFHIFEVEYTLGVCVSLLA